MLIELREAGAPGSAAALSRGTPTGAVCGTGCYRIAYHIDEVRKEVTIVAVGHRRP